MGSKEEALCTQDTLDDVCMTGSKICISRAWRDLHAHAQLVHLAGKVSHQSSFRLTEDGRECTFSAGTGRYSYVKGDLAYILNF